MKWVLATVCSSLFSLSALAKAYFAPLDDMIGNAEVIAVVTITRLAPAHAEEASRRYKDMIASVTVNQVIKGKLASSTEIYIPSFFPCATVEVTEGDFMVFLEQRNGQLTSSNWHLSLRPMMSGKIEWISDDRKEVEFIELSEAIGRINAGASTAGNAILELPSHSP